MDGPVRIYYENGGMRAEMLYVEGLIEGEARFFSEKGSLKQINTYIDGKLKSIKKIGKSGEVYAEKVF